MATLKALQDRARTFGFRSLISVSSDAKTIKGQKQGFLTGIMYAMPDDNLCPMAKIAGCRQGCLVSAGRAALFSEIGERRHGRTMMFHQDRETFVALLIKEIDKLIRKANKLGMIPAVRLNGTSDIDWTTVKVDGQTLFQMYPEVQFYDYTKRPNILRKAASIPNYHVTASYSEVSDWYASKILESADASGANLAVVFRTKEFPKTFLGRPVINGDETDLRFTDPKGVIVALKAKGKARQDTTGFVIG
jgi:hypothetical protein